MNQKTSLQIPISIPSGYELSAKPHSIKILGINFFNGSVEEIVDKLSFGGLLVVPAAPALANIEDDKYYYSSLLDADFVIADSGFMTLIWNMFSAQKINRISGLTFLNSFLQKKEIAKESDIFLVDPSLDDSKATREYLQGKGFKLSAANSYLAPFYDACDVRDADLLKRINDLRPKYIIINIGGGVQEKLGQFLRNNLVYKPAIICTGAAIAFLTGRQVKISNWGDKLFLGWLFRCLDNPKVYVRRYLKAFGLATILLKNGSEQLS